MADTKGSGAGSAAPAGPKTPAWAETFLSALAASSNVSASARKAGIHTATAYDARRNDPEFNRKWQAALCEGYEHLEMDLLCRLRKGELKPAKDAARAVRSYDNATAFRLLQAHRETAANQRAIRENEDADAILASIDAKLDMMRRRAQQRTDPASDDAE